MQTTCKPSTNQDKIFIVLTNRAQTASRPNTDQDKISIGFVSPMQTTLKPNTNQNEIPIGLVSPPIGVHLIMTVHRLQQVPELFMESTIRNRRSILFLAAAIALCSPLCRAQALQIQSLYKRKRISRSETANYLMGWDGLGVFRVHRTALLGYLLLFALRFRRV